MAVQAWRQIAWGRRGEGRGKEVVGREEMGGS